MSKAAIVRLLRFTTRYEMKLKKNERVRPGTMEINLHPSDYERDAGNVLQVDVFNTLSKTHLVADTSGNIAAFLALWKKKGFSAAVDGVKLKYSLPEIPTEKYLVRRIDAKVGLLLEHFAIGVPRTPVGKKEGGNGGTVGKKEGGGGMDEI